MKRLVKRALRRKTSVVAAGVLLLIILAALFAPMLAPADPNAQDLLMRLQAPGMAAGHALGTDQLGRDVLTRIIYGSRVSLAVGLAAAGFAALIGTVLGLIAGFYGGWVGNFIMRLADTQLAIPGILLALAMVAVLGPSLRNLVIVLGISGWVTCARVVRAQALALREQDFVEGGRAIGADSRRILLRYLLPNLWSSLIVVVTMQVATFMISEASLSFLGLGVPLDTPTWGGMLNDGQLFVASAWWVATFPGLAIVVTVLSINLVGDLLRDVLDPKLTNP